MMKFDKMWPVPSRGYSLIELVLVILLISIIAATAISLFPGKAVELGAQAQQLAGDIRYVQSLSMTRGARHSIVLQANGYSIANASGAVAHPGGSASITLRGITLTFPSASYAFDGKGVPYAGSTALATDATITLTDTASSQTRSVVITQQTGRVSVP